MTSGYSKANGVGPYRPAIIIHGGAGSITRSNLPADLYCNYHTSLTNYLVATKANLDAGSSALDSACYAVSMLEDDPLFNCGKGSVFTEDGTIEMEASVMVASINPNGPPAGGIKRAAAVSMVRNTKHPILLAKEVLVSADVENGLGPTSSMHCHLSGLSVETWGWEKRGLEKKDLDWFWTRRRWEEHKRGLKKSAAMRHKETEMPVEVNNEHQIPSPDLDILELPSQGTVGAVCMDSWGNLAVATSTGGLTNKKSGRIGDTPTVGGGFWAESWEEDNSTRLSEDVCQERSLSLPKRALAAVHNYLDEFLSHCLRPSEQSIDYKIISQSKSTDALGYDNENVPKYHQPLSFYSPLPMKSTRTRRRAMAMSGTGNGDSFLRIDAARSVASICRFSGFDFSLSKAITRIAGRGGELQRSSGSRWGKTGEGQGGIIGIEISDDGQVERSRVTQANVVFDFNCGGLWRAWYQVNPKTGQEIPKVMVFREEY